MEVPAIAPKNVGQWPVQCSTKLAASREAEPERTLNSPKVAGAVSIACSITTVPFVSCQARSASCVSAEQRSLALQQFQKEVDKLFERRYDFREVFLTWITCCISFAKAEVAAKLKKQPPQLSFSKLHYSALTCNHPGNQPTSFSTHELVLNAIKNIT